jgi:hypothetical protein
MMNFERKDTQRRRASERRVFGVVALEESALLAASAETFTGPSLSDLIALARQAVNTAPAGIDRMLQALQTQLTSGPLADLTAGTVNGNDNYSAAANGTGDLTVTQAGTNISSVSGTATGGMASLTATITSSVTRQPISGLTLNFTLDDTSVGPATTNSSGVATLTGIATSDPVGTLPNAVAAAFAGDTSYSSSNGTGTLRVS